MLVDSPDLDLAPVDMSVGGDGDGAVPGDDLALPGGGDDGGSGPNVGIAQGACHGCAWRDGKAWCWGANTFGALGDGTTKTRDFAAPVQGLDAETIVQVAVGCGNPTVTGHSCALTINGEAFCWGSNANGQLGDQSGSDQPLPAKVIGLSGAVALSLGAGHSCALMSDGRVLCWGDNEYFQIGDGTAMNRPSPTPATGIADAVEIAAGSWHTCARRSSGALACWGPNAYGEIGDDSMLSAYVPQPVTGIADAVQLVAGSLSTCARRSDGTAWCWGSGEYGTLGNGTKTKMQLTPVQVTLPFSPTTLATNSATCARHPNGSMWCWGPRVDADGITTDIVTTPSPLGPLPDAARLSGSCATRVSTGSVACWGFNSTGAVGDGTMTARPQPVAVVGLPF